MKSKNIFDEWKECRNTIGRFDEYLVKIRLVGFSGFTILLTTVIGVIALKKVELSNLSGDLLLVGVLTLLLFETAVYILDRYYERMLLLAVLRTLQLEAFELEAFNIGLTTEIEFQKEHVKRMARQEKSIRASTMVNLVYILIYVSLLLQYLYIIYNFDTDALCKIGCGFFLLVTMILGIIAHRLLREPHRLIEERAGIILSPVVLSQSEVEAGVGQVATMVHRWLSGKSESKYLNIVAILVGARPFTKDLVDALRKLDEKININLHLISVCARNEEKGGRVSRRLYGKVKEQNITGNPTLIVDDSLASGETMKWVYEKVDEAKPGDLRTAVLVKKYDDSVFDPDFIGFELGLNKETLRKEGVEDYWLFGYGMDIDGLYRKIEHVGWIKVPIRVEKVRFPYLPALQSI